MTAVNGPAPAAAEMLSVRDLSVHFGGLKAVREVSFDVRPSEVLSLIGPNGAGKTTAFNAITGYLAPTAGVISYGGERLDGMAPHQIAKRGIVRTFQKTSLFGTLSVLDNVRTGLHRRAKQTVLATLLGLPSVAAEEAMLCEKARDIIAFLGLSARANDLGSALPYGEQRLLEVAVALAAEPKLLLLDEPVSGMNPAETANFMRILERIRELGITILLVEHDMKIVMGISDRVVVLNQGALIAAGPPGEIQRHPEVIKAYLGTGYAHAQH
jgi:branched-chain amino acid transport system ATP-binding protein